MELGAHAPVLYAIDSADRLVSVGGAWSAFALANGAPGLAGEGVLGHCIWEFLADAETTHLYEVLFEKVRQTGETITVPFRCDAPAVRRDIDLWIAPRADAIQFESRVRREEARPALAVLDPTVERSRAIQKICCWCKRIKAGGDWLEIEDGISRLGLFQAMPLPMLSHAVCQDCLARIRASLS